MGIIKEEIKRTKKKKKKKKKTILKCTIELYHNYSYYTIERKEKKT
jgi:hypothetical protein